MSVTTVNLIWIMQYHFYYLQLPSTSEKAMQGYHTCRGEVSNRVHSVYCSIISPKKLSALYSLHWSFFHWNSKPQTSTSINFSCCSFYALPQQAANLILSVSGSIDPQIGQTLPIYDSNQHTDTLIATWLPSNRALPRKRWTKKVFFSGTYFLCLIFPALFAVLTDDHCESIVFTFFPNTFTISRPPFAPHGSNLEQVFLPRKSRAISVTNGDTGAHSVPRLN